MLCWNSVGWFWVKGGRDALRLCNSDWRTDFKNWRGQGSGSLWGWWGRNWIAAEWAGWKWIWIHISACYTACLSHSARFQTWICLLHKQSDRLGKFQRIKWSNNQRFGSEARWAQGSLQRPRANRHHTSWPPGGTGRDGKVVKGTDTWKASSLGKCKCYSTAQGWRRPRRSIAGSRQYSSYPTQFLLWRGNCSLLHSSIRSSRAQNRKINEPHASWPCPQKHIRSSPSRCVLGRR